MAGTLQGMRLGAQDILNTVQAQEEMLIPSVVATAMIYEWLRAPNVTDDANLISSDMIPFLNPANYTSNYWPWINSTGHVPRGASPTAVQAQFKAQLQAAQNSLIGAP